MNPETTTNKLELNPDDLYLEETFTDRRAGTLRRLSPVTAEGTPDASRAVLYIGQAQILTPMGAMPIAFEIEADSLRAAIEKFPEASQAAVERTARELEELRREAASQIVIPKSGGGMPGAPGGGIPGGGIQMP
ncbi:MAG: hypothetical protein Kow006_31100 [Gammaproteobacteria bacterium]